MDNKRAPVQGWAAGIPWELHLEAYSAYCKKYGPQQALIEGGCRGGFGTGELDVFIPGWRERSSVLTAALARVHALTKERDDYILKQKVWESANDELRSEHIKLKREIDDLQRLPQALVGFIPQTYGDAIRAGWIKHGDCPSHEWDNRTSAANARWMLERAGFASPSITSAEQK